MTPRIRQRRRYRSAAILLALLSVSACGEMTPEQANRMAALGRSMQAYGAQISANSRPVYVYSPSYRCGSDLFGVVCNPSYF